MTEVFLIFFSLVGSDSASFCAARFEGGMGLIICMFFTTELSGLAEEGGECSVTEGEGDKGGLVIDEGSFSSKQQRYESSATYLPVRA